MRRAPCRRRASASPRPRLHRRFLDLHGRLALVFGGDDTTTVPAIGSLWIRYDPATGVIGGIAGEWVAYLQPSGTSPSPDVDDME